MVPVKYGSHGGSQSSFEARSEACQSEDRSNRSCSNHVSFNDVCPNHVRSNHVCQA